MNSLDGYAVQRWQDHGVDFVLGRMSPQTFEQIDASLSPLVHAALGLPVEAAEFADLVKKVVFGKLTREEAEKSMRDELSDVLFYLLLACEYTDLDLTEALKHLQDKLAGGYGWRSEK